MAANVTIKAIGSSTVCSPERTKQFTSLEIFPTRESLTGCQVHQIQSGQVIVDLCSVAKELVENSIDAGATNIGEIEAFWKPKAHKLTSAEEVRFKNQGLDAIEVQDNGSGISPQNYESLALKHYTSKLSSYDDLTTLQTFGFRGEALSSLSALARLSIVTCTQQDAPRAKRLEFETSGKLKGTSVVSGQKGTVVFVEDLFRTLPVRRRELERNIKREWGKVINLLNQYACVQTGIKFTVSQQPTKGKRMVMFSTKGNPTTRDNIINIFGVKTANALITLDLKLELKPTAGPGKKGKAADDDSTTEVRVVGHVSRPSHGEGRQTPDRQMFYVNGRPCGLPQFAKVINEVYRSYNAPQTPFIFADIQLDTHLYDVNVSPDKRTILLHDQGQMLDTLRESLTELFETQDVTIPVAQTPAQKITPFKRAVGASLGTPTLVSAQSTKVVDGPEEDLSSQDHDDELSSDEGSEADSERRAVNEKPMIVSKKSSIRPIITRASSANLQTSSLMSRWLERKSDARDGSDPSALAVRKNSRADALSSEKPLDGNEADRSIGDTGPKRAPTPQENIYDDSGEEELDTPHQAAETRREDMDFPRMEVRVAAIPPPSQPPRSQHVSPVRPFRMAAQEIATITIGDEAMTGIIGSPAKRLKAEKPTVVSSSASLGRVATRSIPVPSFGGRLTQLFSASASTQKDDGSELNITMEDIEAPLSDEEDVDEDEDSLFVSQREGEADEKMAEEEEEEGEEGGEMKEEGEQEQEQEEQEEQDEELEAPTTPWTSRLKSKIGDETPGLPGDENGPAEPAESPSNGSEKEMDDDEAYVDDDEKKAQEDKKVQDMIDAAEAKAVPELVEDKERRSQMLLKGLSKRKESTLNLQQGVNVNLDTLRRQVAAWESSLPQPGSQTAEDEAGGLEVENAEEKLSLKISKTDFANMRIVGQFNLGFVLAVREAAPKPSSPEVSSETQQPPSADDELFIIDQHASDEKYNFERLQASTVVQSQRLVQPKTLELTAVEEEIIIEHATALERNGFVVSVDQSGDRPVGARCQLLSLPLSRETTFSVSDLEELIFLLGDNPSSSATTVPRPSKVRKMFAMRACRSSIMIGRALSQRQMEKVVRHMGEMEKPWNCPHGRPTMRHLCGLGAWEERAWKEGDRFDDSERIDWAAWAREKREEMA